MLGRKKLAVSKLFEDVSTSDTKVPRVQSKFCQSSVVKNGSRMKTRVEKQRWSPRRHILESLASTVKFLALASKSQVIQNWPVLGSRTALFFVPLKSHWKTPKTSRKKFYYYY